MNDTPTPRTKNEWEALRRSGEDDYGKAQGMRQLSEELETELIDSQQLCEQYKEIAGEYHKQLDELTHAVGFKALQESFNSSRKLILKAKLEALNAAVAKTGTQTDTFNAKH